jgi:hypothetical protein
MKNSFFIQMKVEQLKRCIKRINPWIMGRTACLGNDLLKRLDFNMAVCNVQKGRIDYLLESWLDNDNLTRAKEVVPHIIRNDIKNLIVQQQVLYSPLFSKPKLVFMDSFAELTDQLFQCNGKHWSFCANYSDIEHSKEFKNKFSCKGLLPEEDIENKLDSFIININAMFGEIPIIYVNFPTALDDRKKFKNRGEKILSAASKAAKKYSHFYSFSIDESIVDFPENTQVEFPYHYCDRVYDTFAEKIKSHFEEL